MIINNMLIFKNFIVGTILRKKNFIRTHVLKVLSFEMKLKTQKLFSLNILICC